MEIIGFIAVVLFAGYLTVAAFGVIALAMGFGGKFPWAAFLLFGSGAASTWYYAFTHSPFSIVAN